MYRNAQDASSNGRIIRNRTGVITGVACLAIWARVGLAQAPPPVILEIDLENWVVYFNDVSDPSKLAADPNQTTPSPRTFMQNFDIADIVAVNGQPAKGTFAMPLQFLPYRPAPTAGQHIADILRNGGPTNVTFEILQPDGTPIGTIMGQALTAGSPPPGAPLAVTSYNGAVFGGTGAFLGMRGQFGTQSASNFRVASQSEDPSLRRVYGGGKARMVLHLIPMSRPEIVATSSGPAIFHADLSPVTAARPGKAGEVLIVQAAGLGPTVPGVDPGQPFPLDALQQVNSPVLVLVNGKAADVINKIGWPGLVDRYRVDFRVPEVALTGMQAVQLTAAWIAGHSVEIPVQ